MQPSNPTPETQPNQQAKEQLPGPISPETPLPQQVEKAPAGQETAPRPSGDTANQNAGAPVMPVPQPIAKDQPAQTVPTTTDDTPAVADDVDVIEKEWVEKAKSVVDETREDPHQQKEEIDNVKTGYLKKRYNKEVKKPEE